MLMMMDYDVYVNDDEIQNTFLHVLSPFNDVSLYYGLMGSTWEAYGI